MNVQFDRTSEHKLEEIRLKEEEDLVKILAKRYGLASVDLKQTIVNPEALRLIQEKAARVAEVAPFEIKNKNIDIAIRTPNAPETQKALEAFRKNGYKVTPHMASHASLEHAWGYYKEISFAAKTEAGVMDISGEKVARLTESLTSIQKTRDAISEALTLEKQNRTTRIMEVLLAGALANRASDIHLEPEEGKVGARFRLHGVLANAAEIDNETYRSMLVRVKLLSGLKINILSDAQDGRFSVELQDRDIEIRTSVLPGNYGESIVMRILDPRSISKPLEELGMHPKMLKRMMSELERPNGMILNTGPTGSGKTTTLYAFMNRVKNPDIKILTIEDPVEYHLSGIVQTQVDHKNYTFASGLRSALRQDPDIIMVGEIRDREVAETAIHAALTGHLVFSTLHTNDAAGAFPRLVDLGIDPSIVGSAVNAVMAQRLLRTLDDTKKKEVPIEGEDKILIERVLAGITDRSLIPDNKEVMWVPDVPEGEPEYNGRVAVYEVIHTSREIEELVRRNPTIREIEDLAIDQGMITMHQDAVIKILNGSTTISELRRILGEPS